MEIEKIKEKLQKYRKQDIIITDHAVKQAIFRGIDLDEVRENIINPERLAVVKKEKSINSNEEKYDCYFK